MKKSTQIVIALIATSMLLTAGTGKAITHTAHVIGADEKPIPLPDGRWTTDLTEKLTEEQKREAVKKAIRQKMAEEAIRMLPKLDPKDEESRKLLEDIALYEGENAAPHLVQTRALAILGTEDPRYETMAFEFLKEEAYQANRDDRMRDLGIPNDEDPECEITAFESPREETCRAKQADWNDPRITRRIKHDMWELLRTVALRNFQLGETEREYKRYRLFEYQDMDFLSNWEIEGLIHDEALRDDIRALGTWGIEDTTILTKYAEEAYLTMMRYETEHYPGRARKYGDEESFLQYLKENPEERWKAVLGDTASVILQIREEWAQLHQP